MAAFLSEPLAALGAAAAEPDRGVVGVEVHDRRRLAALVVVALAARELVAAREDVLLELLVALQGADLDLRGVVVVEMRLMLLSLLMDASSLFVYVGRKGGERSAPEKLGARLTATQPSSAGPKHPPRTNKPAPEQHKQPNQPPPTTSNHIQPHHQSANTPRAPTLSPLRSTTTMSPYAPKRRGATRTSATSWYATSVCLPVVVMLCCVVVMLCYVMLCYVMLCYVMLCCHVMLCHVMLCCCYVVVMLLLCCCYVML